MSTPYYIEAAVGIVFVYFTFKIHKFMATITEQLTAIADKFESATTEIAKDVSEVKAYLQGLTPGEVVDPAVIARLETIATNLDTLGKNTDFSTIGTEVTGPISADEIKAQ